MDAGLLLQYLVIALAVLVSVGVVVRKRAPRVERALRRQLALPLLRDGRPRWLQRIGRWLAPVPVSGGAACGGCDSCGSSSTPKQH